MIVLIQRVSEAKVTVAGDVLSEIEAGMLCLVGVEKDDTEEQADKLASRLLNYRLFEDQDGKMNLDVTEVGGDILLVSQFTLAADTSKGRRAGFSTAASPDRAKELYDCFVKQVRGSYSGKIGEGRFGANMQVSLTNDGPITFWLQSN